MLLILSVVTAELLILAVVTAEPLILIEVTAFVANCVAATPAVLIVTSPDVTLKFPVLNLAIPLLVAVASSPDIEPEEISIPSPAEIALLILSFVTLAKE